MTASWKAVGISRDGSTVELCWGDRRSPQYRCTVTDPLGNHDEKSFETGEGADNWAIELGVSSWRVVAVNRCLPEAVTLPMEFEEAPNKTVLADLLDRVKERKESIREVAGSIGAHPVQLIAWLRGFAPGDSAVPRLQRR